MEISNDFWTMLTTENAMLNKVFVAPTVIIELWLGFLLFTSILKIKYTKLNEFFYILFLSLTSLATEFLVKNPFNIFINYVITFIIIKSTFKLDLLKTLLSTIIPSIVFALVGTLILKPFLTFMHISYYQTETIPIYRFIYLFTLYIIVLLILIFIELKNLRLSILEEFTSNNQKIIFLNIIFGFFTLCIQALLTIYHVTVVPFTITLLNFISLFAYFFISFYSLNKTMKLQVTTRELENAEYYNNSLSLLYDNVKSFKHDFDNMVFTIGGFINTNDIDGLKKYYKDLEKDCQRVNNIALLNPKIVNNAGIYNLLMAKYKKATEVDVELTFEIFFDFEKMNMPIYEFARLFGILLDNAIEAASEAKNKIVHVIIRDSINTKTQLVCVKNTYINKNIDKNKIFEKGVTGKENHSGMGLWEVAQIISRNSNIKLLTNNDDTYFSQQLEIYY